MKDLPPELPVEPGIPEALRRRNRHRVATVSGLVLLLVAALIVAGLALRTATQANQALTRVTRVLATAQVRATRTVCIAEMQGDVFAALGASLNAPPSPSPQRAASVVAIAERASRFKNIPKYCPAGHEHPVVPKG